MTQTKQNIVMLPYMAQGHLIPFLALALQLQNTDKYTITFITTHSNLTKLSSSLPPNSSINLLEIPFDAPFHNTDSITYSQSFLLLQASLSLKPHFRKLIHQLIVDQQGTKPLCIISDLFFGWCEDIAREFGVFHAMFIAGGGFGFACYHSLWMNLPHLKTESDEFLLPDFPDGLTIHRTQLTSYLKASSGDDFYSMLLQNSLSLWKNVGCVLINTVEEIDRTGVMYFRRQLNRQVWTIGPVLLSTRTGNRAGKNNGISVEDCRKWLDTKRSGSVLYVSFGSQNTISQSQMMELALALEKSGKNFIWVVRPPLGFDINSEFKSSEWLPEGFEERVIKGSKQGLLVHKWAPQVEILSHKSTSAFLSHCGWNSTLEALSNGVPMLGWPIGAEQFYNVKMLEEEIGVCVEVARGIREVQHEELVSKFELVMDSGRGKGEEMKRRAMEVKEIIKNAMKDEEGFKGSSVKAMDEFLNAANTMMEKNTICLS